MKQFSQLANFQAVLQSQGELSNNFPRPWSNDGSAQQTAVNPADPPPITIGSYFSVINPQNQFLTSAFTISLSSFNSNLSSAILSV